MSQDIHPSVLTIQAILWIVGVSKKTSRSDHLPLRRALDCVSTWLAAIFEQKQTLGKREETAQSAHEGMLNRYLCTGLNATPGPSFLL